MKSSRKILILLLVISVSWSSLTVAPKQAHAVAGVWIDTTLNYHSVMDNLKEFVLNKAAVMIANQLIQRMTASVVNWINTGFQGSPAFLTNPEGFFLDVGDQVTGAFLDKEGTLSKLCSPFSLDIRLSLALGQTQSASQRYTCTLGKIVNNVNGTIEGFTGGDFAQGGWPVFISMTTEPQNNVYGSYLQAHSDLLELIGKKNGSINQDLNRGNGFLSWQKCTDVTSGYTSGQFDGGELGLQVSQENQLRQSGNKDLTVVTGKTDLNQNTSIKKTRDQKTGIMKYESCQTQTPGSVIGGSLQRQLNIPADKLVLVKTISDSIDAMTGALVNQMFTQGLAALSSRGSSGGGSNRSYLADLYAESANPNSAEAQSLKTRAGDSSSSLVTLAQNTIGTYDKDLALLNASRSSFETARACFVSKLGIADLSPNERSYAESQIATIDLIIAGNIDSTIASTSAQKVATQNALTDLQASLAGSYIPGLTGNDISQRFAKLDALIGATGRTTQSGIDNASAASTASQSVLTMTTALNKNAQTFQNSCVAFPNNHRF